MALRSSTLMLPDLHEKGYGWKGGFFAFNSHFCWSYAAKALTTLMVVGSRGFLNSSSFLSIKILLSALTACSGACLQEKNWSWKKYLLLTSLYPLLWEDMGIWPVGASWDSYSSWRQGVVPLLSGCELLRGIWGSHIVVSLPEHVGFGAALVCLAVKRVFPVVFAFVGPPSLTDQAVQVEVRRCHCIR